MDGNGRGLLIRYFRLSCTLMCVCVYYTKPLGSRMCVIILPTAAHTHTDTHSDFIDFCFWGFFSFRERAKVQQFFFFVSFVKLSLPASQSRMYVYVLNGSCCSCRFLFCNGPNKLPGKKKSPSFSLDIHIDMYACIYSVSTGAAISAGCV